MPEDITMSLYKSSALIDELLHYWKDSLGDDFSAYRNHCYRVLNFCIALHGADDDDETIEKVAIAAAFHDLGIWVRGTFDYLAPSRALARAFLAEREREDWIPEIEAMIEQHHKVRRYSDRHDSLVEAFRKADWTDVSLGIRRFGLSRQFYRQVCEAFPNAGFHRKLVGLTVRRFIRHPLSPLPMMRW